MTAFLYISPRDGLARRVDVSNIASLFSEPLEPPQARRGRRGSRMVAALLLVLIAIGDTVLVRSPDALASLNATSRHTSAGPGRFVSL